MMQKNENNNSRQLGLLLMQHEPEKYEEYLLAACITDEELWTKFEKHLCVRNKGNWIQDVNDFSSIIRYALFKAIKAYRRLCGGFTAINEAGVLIGLKTEALQNPRPVIEQEEFPKVLELFRSISNITQENARAVILKSWTAWLGNVQFTQSVLDVKRGGYTPDILDKLNAIASIQNNLEEADKGDEDEVVAFGDVCLQDEDNTERIPLGPTFKGLNTILGGGFGKGEHVLAVVPTGGGKTTLSCQLAAEVASAGRHALIISTEQKYNQLIPRIVSALSWTVATSKENTIKFDKIKDGMTKKKFAELSIGQQKVFKQISDAIGPYLHIASWNHSDNKISDIPRLLEKENAKLPEGEEIEFVILDWIGGAVTRMAKDSNEKYNIMLAAAYEMHKLAETYNVACLSTCQTNDKGKNTIDVDSTAIADCHALPNEAEVAFGISAVKAKTGDNLPADGTSVYSIKQRLNCFKTRKSEAMKIDIERNFGWQRFNKL